MSKISKKGKTQKLFFFSNFHQILLIISFQLTQVSSFYLIYFLIYGIYKILFQFFQRAVILQGEIIQKKYFFFLGGGGGGGRVRGWGSGFGGVRVDVNEELKFLRK